MLCSPEDRVVIKTVLSGRTEKFDFLIAKYQEKLFHFVLSRVGKPETSEDLTQDIFLAAYQKLSSYRMESKFSTWLYGIAVNVIHNHFNKSKNNGYYFLSEKILIHEPAEEELPLEALERKITSKLLLQTIDGLKYHLKEVFILVVFEDFSYEEAAQILDIPVGTVKSRMFSARLELKQKITKLEILS